MTISSQSSTATPVRCRTAADWVHELGDIPLERIIIDPWPATETDLLRKVEVEKQLCELVNDTLVEKPMGLYESLVAMVLVQELLNFVRPRKLGIVAGPDGPLRLKLGLVRAPDLSYISSERLKQSGSHREAIPSLVPDLAVEVLSVSNTAKEMDRKREEYFGAGVRMVWLIDPRSRIADSYRSVQDCHHVEPGGRLLGAEVLPGFEIGLTELFEAADAGFAGDV